MERKALSTFAVALRSLLDDHGTMRRSEWAEVLGVSEAAISQWVNDAAIPKAENLRAIMNTLIADRRVPTTALESFEELMHHPSSDVSPNGDRMKPTVSHYLVKPLREAFLRTLETLPPEGQEVVLLEGSTRCRQIRSNPIVRRSIEERRRLQFESLIEEATGSRIEASIVSAPARVPEDAAVPDTDLAAQLWMQEVLLVAVGGVSAHSISKPLSIARKASVKNQKRERPIDELSVWIKATDELLRGVKSTMVAAESAYLDAIAAQGRIT